MALLWTDGFDHYGTVNTTLAINYATVLGYPVFESTIVRTGARALRLQNGLDIRRNFSANQAEVGLATGFYVASLSQDTGITFYDTSAVQVMITSNAAGGITVWRGDRTTSLGTSAPGLIAVNTWVHLETHVLFSQTVGTVEVRLNGVIVVNSTGLDTCATANAYATGAGYKTSGTTPNMYVDDLVIWDTSGSAVNTFVGPARVGLLMPTADTGTNSMGFSTGSATWSLIDEIPASDADYVVATAAAQQANCTVASLVGPAASVVAVQAFARALAPDGGAPAMAVGVNGDAGSSAALGVGASMLNAQYSTNPTTGLAWQVVDIASLAWHSERTA